MGLLELGDGESSDGVAHLLSGLDGSLHQPLSGCTQDRRSRQGHLKVKEGPLPHLDHREDVDEVQALDLMRLQAMRTLHFRKHRHDLLCQSSRTRGEEAF